MFTIEQIQNASNKVKSGKDFPQFAHDLKIIGVIQYDNHVSDGKTNYFGHHGYVLLGKAKYQSIPVKPMGSAEQLKQALLVHQQGDTDYLTFCRQAGEAGVKKWTTDLKAMTVTYYDENKNKLVVEKIPGI